MPRPIDRVIRPAILIAVIGLAAIPLWAQSLDCSDCHEPIGSTAHGELECAVCHAAIDEFPHPEGTLAGRTGDAGCRGCHELPAELAGSVHEGLTCDTCHAASPHEVVAPDDTPCRACHDTSAELVAESVHGDAVACQQCHGDPHRIVPVADGASPVSQLRQVQVCGTCHGGESLDGYLGSVHARALMVKGLVSAPACGDCHGSHDIRPGDDERSRFAAKHVPETCGSCHRYVLETWRDQSAHGTAWLAGEGNGPVCTTCHSSHRVVPPNVGNTRLKFPDDCGNCHGDRYASYNTSFHGEATDLGMLATATCSDCHTPHANLPASDPRSSVHPDRLAETCGSCHARISSSFLTFDVHSDPAAGNGHPAVRWTWLLMTGLLISVFIFFGIHDILWLQRSIVALLRGDLTRVAHTANKGVWVRRFRKTHMWVHLVVIVTFLTLAATGLPLKFHHTAWARQVASLLGGIEFARVLHRLAAILTFGYAIFHLVHLVRRVYVRRERTILWGWRSLVPQPQDLFDMFAHIRWFLYLGPQPRFGRWTYWEKFDYFAVFWGVAIIGTSGLLLWFPWFFTLFLPGWVLNVALIIHSDEALLATSFIFVFHFFHGHLRPENFPLDPVMFVGAVPLERFIEERPLEHEQLVAEGRLEEFIVPAPGRVELRRAYWFGGVALTIGLLLAYGILYGLLTH